MGTPGRSGALTPVIWNSSMASSGWRTRIRLAFRTSLSRLFIENPLKTVPGTKMGYAGVKDPQERADLIAYLKKATSDPKICD